MRLQACSCPSSNVVLCTKCCQETFRQCVAHCLHVVFSRFMTLAKLSSFILDRGFWTADGSLLGHITGPMSNLLGPSKVCVHVMAWSMMPPRACTCGTYHCCSRHHKPIQSLGPPAGPQRHQYSSMCNLRSTCPACSRHHQPVYQAAHCRGDPPVCHRPAMSRTPVDGGLCRSPAVGEPNRERPADRRPPPRPRCRGGVIALPSLLR